jgi:hypothetical protein
VVKEKSLKSFFQIIRLGRQNIRSFLAIGFLASPGTGISLFEPWIYRAMIDDIAGIFVAPHSLRASGCQ